MNILKKVLIVLGMFFVSGVPAFAQNHTVSTEFSVTVPQYMNIKPVTSPVLTANITNRTGNLHMPLSTRFRVVTNASQTKTLYLQANTTTEGGYETAMFERGGQVYVAFANMSKIPTSSALANCKYGSAPKDSPGVVAYPITYISGAQHKYIGSKSKYEVYVNNGTTDITVNIGSNVLRDTFAGNDPRGFYQAVLSLTEADI